MDHWIEEAKSSLAIVKGEITEVSGKFEIDIKEMVNKLERKNDDIVNKVDRKTERVDRKIDRFVYFFIAGIFLKGGYDIVIKEETLDHKILKWWGN